MGCPIGRAVPAMGTGDKIRMMMRGVAKASGRARHQASIARMFQDLVLLDPTLHNNDYANIYIDLRACNTSNESRLVPAAYSIVRPASFTLERLNQQP